MATSRRARRRWSLLLAAVVAALIVPLVSASPASAVDINPFDTDCKEPPAPSRPDSGIAGWFLSEPRNPSTADPFAPNATVSMYDVYGYAGLSYTTYDLGCGGSARDPGAASMTEMANIVAAPAMWLVALDNSVREYAYRPNSMWGWTNNLVQRASDALRDRIFSVWGAVVLAIVGLWLLWGARGGNMSHAVVTAGWAVLVMAVVTAVAAWPVKASTVADNTLTGALGQVTSVLAQEDPNDKREPAVRASGVLTETVLYKQWLRGTLGSADSETAKKYGPSLYQARAISWAEAKEMRKGSDERKQILDRKGKLWTSTAEKIQDEDPDAYEYLVGRRGSERVGSSLLALISAVVVTPFDIMASLLILVAFLIIRLAVAFLPAIGTVGILRPASGPLRGLLRTVLAAMINCVIFGAGSAVFLLAVEVITGTSSLAGWQQVLLIWLTGLILWLLLRPYRRLTQLTGVDPFGELAGGLGRMHKKVFGDIKQLAIAGGGAYLGDVSALEANDKKRAQASRPENWSRKATVQPPQGAPVPAAQGPLEESRRKRAEVLTAAENAERNRQAAAAAEHRRPETGPAPDAKRARDGIPVMPATVGRAQDRQQTDYPQAPARPVVLEENAIMADGEHRVIYRPDQGYTRVSNDRTVSARVSQAASNAAVAANAARDAVVAAGALARDSQRRDS